MMEFDKFTLFCEIRRKSHIAPPSERIAPTQPGPSSSWTSWTPEALALSEPQTNVGPLTADSWVVDPSDTVLGLSPPNPCVILITLAHFSYRPAFLVEGLCTTVPHVQCFVQCVYGIPGGGIGETASQQSFTRPLLWAQ
jgi:hypothetical protein